MLEEGRLQRGHYLVIMAIVVQGGVFMVKVTFLPGNKVIEVPEGSTILQAAVSAGQQIESTCGGRGTCGKCKVKVDPGSIDQSIDPGKKFMSEEELKEGWVLACQVKVEKDLTVTLKTQQMDAHQRKTQLNQLTDLDIQPLVQKHFLKLSRPTVEDQRPDWDRLMDALPNGEVQFNRAIAVTLPKILHEANFEVTAVTSGNSLLAVEPGDTTGRGYGLAIDIGTTTTVAYLMDLNTGKAIASSAVTNPQKAYGADVISRITHASKGPKELKQLQDLVIGGLNEIIADIMKQTGVKREEIYEAVVVSNTTMSHLFMGIDPTYLAPAPFIPVFRQGIQVEAKELGLNILETGHVFLVPNIAGYVGADTVGVMVAAKMDKLEGNSLAIDIGTNGELVLMGKGRILTCSTAAGPAFEGAEIKHGMRAADGAIERVRITDDVELETISHLKPIGICGSGLIDAIGEMARTGVIQETGRIISKPEEMEKLPPKVAERIIKTEEGYEFVLAWAKDSGTGQNIVLTQKDVRELQLAKAAIRAGVSILMKDLGISLEELDRVLLAGAFGNYISKASALQIGLLPNVPIEKIETVGNAAGDGAKMILLSHVERERAHELAKRSDHIELSTRIDFQEEFVDALSFEPQ